jgi:hypothetical protein
MTVMRREAGRMAISQPVHLAVYETAELSSGEVRGAVPAE